MNKESNIIIRVENDLKTDFSKIVADEGFNISEVLCAFMRKVCHDKRIPANMGIYLKYKKPDDFDKFSFVYIRNLIYNYMNSLQGNKNINKIYLFGSYARNEQTKDSDIDLLIETTNKFSVVDQAKFMSDASDMFHKEVDVVSSGNLDPVFANNIKKDMICIYERQQE